MSSCKEEQARARNKRRNKGTTRSWPKTLQLRSIYGLSASRLDLGRQMPPNKNPPCHEIEFASGNENELVDIFAQMPQEYQGRIMVDSGSCTFSITWRSTGR